MEADTTYNLLIIDSTGTEGQALVSELRNAGLAVRPTHVRQFDEAAEGLDAAAYALVLLLGADIRTLERVCGQLRQAQPPVHLVALDSDSNPEAVAAAMKAGARDLVSKHHPDHVQQVVRRELEHAQRCEAVRRYRRAALENERRARTLMDSSRDAIAYVHDGMHTYANAVYLEMFGHKSMEDIEGLPVLDLVADEEHKRFKEFLNLYAKGKAADPAIEVKARREDGTEFSARMEFSSASVEGEPCTQIVIRDQTVSKEMLAEMEAARSQDAITGLYNRQAFLDQLQQAITDVASGGVATLMYIELDKFAAFKETLGLAGVDQAMRDLSQILKQAVRDTEFASRFGDHICTIISRSRDAKHIKLLAEQIRRGVEAHIVQAGNRSTAITCSIGLAQIAREHGPYEALACANMACDKAQAGGGNQIEVYKAPAKAVTSNTDLDWVQRIKKALEQSRFRLSFQPIVSLNEDPEEQYEILVRMLDEKGGEVLPGEFLPAAHSTGMISLIDRWVLGRAIHLLAERNSRGSPTSAFVKISGSACSDSKLLPWVYEKLKAAKINPRHLILEISLDEATANLGPAQNFCRIAKTMKCRVALSRFGLKSDDFSIFKHVAADFIKTHPDLTAKLASDNKALERLSDIQAKAQEMNKTVIASRIEDAASMAAAFSCGLHYIQGNFLQEPKIEMGYDFKSGMNTAMTGMLKALQ